jgi:hypothetical protein
MANLLQSTAEPTAASRDVSDWVRAKETSRQQDRAALASGSRTAQDIHAENTFTSRSWKPDWANMPRI